MHFQVCFGIMLKKHRAQEKIKSIFFVNNDFTVEAGKSLIQLATITAANNYPCGRHFRLPTIFTTIAMANNGIRTVETSY